MDLDPLQVFSDLVRFETRLWNALEARLVRECSLTLGRFEVLRVIQQQAPCRVSDIAESLAITWSGASKLVDRLEDAALCKRAPNPRDGRSSLIELTPAGLRVADTSAAVVADALNVRVVSALGADEFISLAGLLSALNARSATWE